MSLHDSALDRLQREPHRSGFMQAVRLLELHWTRRGLSAQDIQSQRLRFGNSPSMAFPASEIAEFSTRTDPEGELAQAWMVPAFMGLLGAGGTLPNFYTELLVEREALHRDRSARAFLDIFQQRAVWLFYAAWRKHRLALAFELDRRNHYRPLVLALAGIGQPALRSRLAPEAGGVGDDTLAHFAGHLQRRTPTAASLRQILADYFRVGVQVQTFVGRWFTLPRQQQSQLGLGAAQLGHSAVAGERIWQRDLRVRLDIGPLRRAQFQRFLPGGSAQRALRELLVLLTRGTLEFEVRLTLHADDVAPARLSEDDGPRLGWDSFLVTDTVRADRNDAGYDLVALA